MVVVPRPGGLVVDVLSCICVSNLADDTELEESFVDDGRVDVEASVATTQLGIA